MLLGSLWRLWYPLWRLWRLLWESMPMTRSLETLLLQRQILHPLQFVGLNLTWVHLINIVDPQVLQVLLQAFLLKLKRMSLTGLTAFRNLRALRWRASGPQCQTTLGQTARFGGFPETRTKKLRMTMMMMTMMMMMMMMMTKLRHNVTTWTWKTRQNLAVPRNLAQN